MTTHWWAAQQHSSGRTLIIAHLPGKLRWSYNSSPAVCPAAWCHAWLFVASSLTDQKNTCTSIQKHIYKITKSICKRNRPLLISIRLQNGLSKGTLRQNCLFVMPGESGLTSPSNSLPEAFPSHTFSTSCRSGGRPYWVCSKLIITDSRLSH